MVTQKDVLDIWGTSFWKIPETTDRQITQKGRERQREKERRGRDEMRWNKPSSCIVTYNFKHFSAKSIKNTFFIRLKAFNIFSKFWIHSLDLCYIIIRADALRSAEWVMNCVKDYWHAIINAHLMLIVSTLLAFGNDLNLKSLLPWVASTSGWTSSCHFKYFSITVESGLLCNRPFKPVFHVNSNDKLWALTTAHLKFEWERYLTSLQILHFINVVVNDQVKMGVRFRNVGIYIKYCTSICTTNFLSQVPVAYKGRWLYGCAVNESSIITGKSK